MPDMQLAEWIGKRLKRPYACKFVAMPQDRPLLDELQTREELDMDPVDTAFGAFDTEVDGGLLLHAATRSSRSVSAALLDADASLQRVAQAADGSESGESDNSEDRTAGEEGTVDILDARDAGITAVAHTRRCSACLVLAFCVSFVWCMILLLCMGDVVTCIIVVVVCRIVHCW
jgi:hypothetical protein